ncbi:MAG: sigma-70 family RNA polymerase sigma factor [Deltaproteobacteria bacterium]|nr:sigma-70 family RNA polymerase sigma factor [Deltaproteobacteria bacterium]
MKNREDEEILLRRLYPRIVQMVRFAGGNHSQVDDIVQMAAIQVIKSLKWYKGLGSLESWAGRISYRTTMKALKRKRNLEVVQMPFFEQDLSSGETPEKSTSRRQLFDVLIDKLNVIPNKRRVPLLLHIAYGYTIREISEMLDVSPNTIKDRMKTAFREFQSVLDENPNLIATMLEDL